MENKKLSKAIKARRKELGLDQLDVAKAAKLSSTAILSMIENGRGNPTLETLTKICDVLGLEIAAFGKQYKIVKK